MNKEERMNSARALHKQGYNCCQSVVMAFADKLPIDKEAALNVAAPFGRGLAGTREVCGCVSGIERFREDNGDIVCARLLAAGKRPCPDMVAYAAGLLADII